MIGADYFLAPEGDKLLRNAKQFYFDTFCRVHCCLDMSYDIYVVEMSTFRYCRLT